MQSCQHAPLSVFVCLNVKLSQRHLIITNIPVVPATVLNVTTSRSIGPEALTKTHTSTVVLSPVFPGSIIGLTFCNETVAPAKFIKIGYYTDMQLISSVLSYTNFIFGQFLNYVFLFLQTC